MRILLLCQSFNSLTQQLFVELVQRKYQVSVEFDINDRVTEQATALFRPDLIIAPFLKRAIPESVWRRYTCLVVHPGIPGDRGPSALDWAIINEEQDWGVTVLEARAQMDSGPVWAHQPFRMRAARKSSLYRFEVTEAAVRATVEAIARFQNATFQPAPLAEVQTWPRGRWNDLVRQRQRRIDWSTDGMEDVLRKTRAADGDPGVDDVLLGLRCRLFDVHAEDRLTGKPGEIIARRGNAVCRATGDGAVWIGHIRPVVSGANSFKLAATTVLGERLTQVPETPLAPEADISYRTYRDIFYEERGEVGTLHFDFYNGAMSTDQCRRLLAAYRAACRRPTRVIVLAGGEDFWSNGLNLNTIEAAPSPADESWRNINAIDDLANAVINTTTHLTVAAVAGNAGAGGAFLALTTDHIRARAGIVLNPHYKNMGNLYGSEFWTYTLPKRVGDATAEEVVARRLPIGSREALRLGLIDAEGASDRESFCAETAAFAAELASDPNCASQLRAKGRRRQRDESVKPLAQYREEELQRMRLGFYGFDPSYHVARYRFVHRSPRAWTPLHLAIHRQLSWRVPSQRAVWA